MSVPPSGLELPGINYKFNTKKYRFFYGSRVEVSPHPYKVKTPPEAYDLFIFDLARQQQKIVSANFRLDGKSPQCSWPREPP